MVNLIIIDYLGSIKIYLLPLFLSLPLSLSLTPLFLKKKLTNNFGYCDSFPSLSKFRPTHCFLKQSAIYTYLTLLLFFTFISDVNVKEFFFAL